MSRLLSKGFAFSWKTAWPLALLINTRHRERKQKLNTRTLTPTDSELARIALDCTVYEANAIAGNLRFSYGLNKGSSVSDYDPLALRLQAGKELFTRALLDDLHRLKLNLPNAASNFLKAKFAGQRHESFWCLWIDVKNGLISAEEMFRGTLTQTSVYPREVVKRAVELDASSVIFSHNHPSGSSTPSRADEVLTTTLKTALALVDCRVQDHIVVSNDQSYSFAERGIL